VDYVGAASLATGGDTGRGTHELFAGQLNDRDATLRPTACLSVFDGRDAVGHVVAWENGRFEAYLTNDTSLGFHDSVEAALAALLAEPAAAVTPAATQPHALTGGRHG